MKNKPAPNFSLPWIVLLFGAAALFIAITQPHADDASPPRAALCLSGKPADR